MTNRTTKTRSGSSKHAPSHWGIIAAVVACLALVAGCSDDSPVTHEPVHYNIYATANKYFDGEKHSRIYIYDADSLTLLDSIPLPNVGDAAVVSPDGRSIYQMMWRYKEDYNSYLAKIDVASRSIVWTQEIPALMGASDGPLNLLDDGRVLGLEGVLFDPETGAMIRQHDYLTENHLNMGYGPLHGTEVAAVQFDSAAYNYYDRSDTLAIAVDLTTGQQRGGFVPRLAPGQLPLIVGNRRLHPDGERVLLLGENSIGSFFVVGNLNTGELLMSARLSTSYGEIAISHDGEMAAVVDEASPGWGIGLPAVHVYDLVEYKHLGTLDVKYDLPYYPGQARFLPGDRRLAVFSSTNPIGSDWLQVIDLNTMTLEHVVDTPFYNALGGGLAIGPRPSS